MTLRIREVNITDPLVQQAIASLSNDTFSKEELVGDRRPDPIGHWWVAFDGPVAVAFAGMVPSLRFAAAGYMCLAGVLPAYRGKGLQKRLIKKRIDKAKALGWKAVFTETICTTVPSIASLIGCGFKPYAPAVPWGHSTAIYWRKQL
jgi:GNAT superfamily N-acetyltransferase